MKRHDLVCNFNLDDCIKTLGLDEGGRVQQTVDKTFLRGVQPFTPWDTGALYDSAIRNTVVGSGEIIFDVDDKARRLYYHPEYNFQGAPMRGGYWADRYLQDGGLEELEREARAEVKRMGK